MSQSSLAPVGTTHRHQSADETTVITAESEVHRILGALEDAECRIILEATGDDSLSAREVSETCEISLSTTYRKLESLAELGLLRERIRIRHSGRHTSEYSRCVEDVVVSLSTGGVELQISRPETPDRYPEPLMVEGSQDGLTWRKFTRGN